jgi:hypothetical protein
MFMYQGKKEKEDEVKKDEKQKSDERPKEEKKLMEKPDEKREERPEKEEQLLIAAGLGLMDEPEVKKEEPENKIEKVEDEIRFREERKSDNTEKLTVQDAVILEPEEENIPEETPEEPSSGKRKVDFYVEMALFLVLGMLIGIAIKTEAAKRVTIGFDDYRMKIRPQQYDMNKLQAQIIEKNQQVEAEQQKQLEKSNNPENSNQPESENQNQ